MSCLGLARRSTLLQSQAVPSPRQRKVFEEKSIPNVCNPKNDNQHYAEVLFATIEHDIQLPNHRAKVTVGGLGKVQEGEQEKLIFISIYKGLLTFGSLGSNPKNNITNVNTIKLVLTLGF